MAQNAASLKMLYILHRLKRVQLLNSRMIKDIALKQLEHYWEDD